MLCSLDASGVACGFSSFHSSLGEPNFDGKTGAERWLKRLQHDFHRAGCKTLDPQLYPESNDMLFGKEAATWLDSSPSVKDLTNDAASVTPETIRTIDKTLCERFPLEVVDMAEPDVSEENRGWQRDSSHSVRPV